MRHNTDRSQPTTKAQNTLQSHASPKTCLQISYDAECVQKRRRFDVYTGRTPSFSLGNHLRGCCSQTLVSNVFSDDSARYCSVPCRVLRRPRSAPYIRLTRMRTRCCELYELAVRYLLSTSLSLSSDRNRVERSGRGQRDGRESRSRWQVNNIAVGRSVVVWRRHIGFTTRSVGRTDILLLIKCSCRRGKVLTSLWCSVGSWSKLCIARGGTLCEAYYAVFT